MIVADGLVVRRGARTVLDGVDLAVPDGSITGIVGPNGSGKTTLLRALLGALPLTAGTVHIDGCDLAHARRRWIARRTAFVGQLLDPDPAQRVRDEVALGGLARHGAWFAQGPGFDDRVDDALAQVGLAGRAEQPLTTLSGGERQRVAIARAIAHAAAHALLDEPTNHLDLPHRLALVHLLPRIAETVVVVLHDLDLAARACDRVLVLDRGRVAASGPTADVLVPAVLDPVYGVRAGEAIDRDGRRRLVFDLPSDHPLPLPKGHRP